MRTRLIAGLVVASIHIAFPGVTSAGSTIWIGPNGGSWSVPQHWSEGVPGPGDTAVLPSRKNGAAYTIVAAPSPAFAALDVHGNVEIDLSKASLTTDALTIGAAEAAYLRIVGGTFTASQATVGSTAGAGALIIDEGADLWAGFVTIGVQGPATLSARGPVSLATYSLVMGADSTCDLLLDLSGQPVIFAAYLTYGGSLSLAFPQAVPLPSPALPAIAAISATGSFSEISPPMAMEQEAWVVANESGVTVPPFDPIVELVFDPSPSPAYVGYARQIGLLARKVSGALGTLCCTEGPESVAWPWEVEDPQVASINDEGFLTGVSEGETVVKITVEWFGKLFSHAEPCVVSTWSSPAQGLDVDCNGDPAEGVLCGIFNGSGGYSVVSTSADGRYVAFSTTWPAFGLTEDCGIFVKDRVSGQVETIPNPPGAVGPAVLPDLSADGRFLTFTQQLDSDDGLHFQTWLFDRETQSLSLVSRAMDGTPGNDDSAASRISADGSTVVYSSLATNIVASAQLPYAQIIAYGRERGVSTLASATINGDPGNGQSEGPAVNANGTRVVFQTIASNLVTPAQGGRLIVVKDLVSGECTLANPTISGAPATDWALRACDIDDSGSRVVFASVAQDFVVGPVPAGSNVYLRDLSDATTTLMTPSSIPRCGLGAAQPAISSDGSYVLCAMPKNSGGWPGHSGAADENCRIYRINVESLLFYTVNAGPWTDAVPAVPSQPALVGSGVGAVFQSLEQGYTFGGPIGPIPHMYLTLFNTDAADLNLDGSVNAEDLALLLGAWGTCAGAADLTRDGMVNGADLGSLLGRWTGDDKQ